MARLLITAATLCGLFSSAVALGFVLFAAMFKLGILAGIPVLFYRGLVLAVLAAIATALLLASAIARLRHPELRRRDAVSAAIVSLSLNIAFLVVVPVTVDRSISVFILGRMASENGRVHSADEIRRMFVDGYVLENRQVERRLQEQLLSGNLERAGDGFRISPQGLSFIQLAKASAWLFDADTRFVAPNGSGHPSAAPLASGQGSTAR
jgi:hypothetical protein